MQPRIVLGAECIKDAHTVRLQPRASCLAGLCTAPPAAPRSAPPSCRPLTQQPARAIAGSSTNTRGVKCVLVLPVLSKTYSSAARPARALVCALSMQASASRQIGAKRCSAFSEACRAPPPRSPMTWARAPCRRAAHGIRDTHVRLRSMHQHARQQERPRPTVYLLENSGEESKHLLIAYTAAEARVSDPHTPLHRRLGPIGPTRSPPGHQHRGSLA